MPSSSQGRSSEAVHPWEAPTNTQQPLNCGWWWPITQLWAQQPEPSWLLALEIWSFSQPMVPGNCWHPPSLPGEGSHSVSAGVWPHAALQLRRAQLLSQVPFCKEMHKRCHPSQLGWEWRAAPSPRGAHPAVLKACQCLLGGSTEAQFSLHRELF